MEKTEYEALVRRTVRIGDTVTHTRCMGCVEEHVYTGTDGYWLCGKATRDTQRLHKQLYGVATWPHVNDIAPCNVTHINRVPVEAVEFLAAQGPNHPSHHSTPGTLANVHHAAP